MPKIKEIHLSDRISRRIDELEQGLEVPAKDLRAVLTREQQAELEATWKAQQQLRIGKRPKTVEEQKALGWKTKREIHLQVLRRALQDAEDNLLAALEKEIEAQKLRRTHIFADNYMVAIDKGMRGEQAQNFANNALTRAGMPRFDRREVYGGLTRRDREVRQMEDDLRRYFEAQMSPTERDDWELFKSLEN